MATKEEPSTGAQDLGRLMMPTEHERYAKKLLSSLSDEHPEVKSLSFEPDSTQSRNAAKAMTAILCNRLYKASGGQPEPEKNTTYEWEEGIFNCRNIADRDYLWSNMRRNVADAIHKRAVKKPVAYLLAFSSPTETTLNVWAIPEPVLHKSLSNLPVKEGGQEYTLQIFTNKQRIAHDAASPDLTSYFRKFPLSPRELLVLRQSRDVDSSVRRSRAIARGDEDTPEITDLKQELDDLQSRPQTPEALREVQRVLKTYERPSLITRYVKRTRGATCQLCGELGFVKRNGKRYCEVHHLFHLSYPHGEPTPMAPAGNPTAWTGTGSAGGAARTLPLDGRGVALFRKWVAARRLGGWARASGRPC